MNDCGFFFVLIVACPQVLDEFFKLIWSKHNVLHIFHDTLNVGFFYVASWEHVAKWIGQH